MLGFFGVGDKIGEWLDSAVADVLNGIGNAIIGGLGALNGSVLAVLRRSPLTDLSIAAPTYNVVWAAALSMAMGALLLSVTGAALGAQPGTAFRRIVVDVPRFSLVTATMLSWTAAVLLGVEEINTALLDSGAGQNLERVLTLEDLKDSGVGIVAVLSPGWLLPFLLVVLLQLILALVMMVVLNLRDMAIFVFAATAPMMAVSLLTPYHQLFKKFLEALFAVIMSKTIIIITLMLGASIITGFRGEVLDPVTIPPPTPAGAGADAPDQEASGASTDQLRSEASGNLFQRGLLGLTVMFLAILAPQKILGLIPGSDAGASTAGMRSGGVTAEGRSAPGVAAAARYRDRRRYTKMMRR